MRVPIHTDSDHSSSMFKRKLHGAEQLGRSKHTCCSNLSAIARNASYACRAVSHSDGPFKYIKCMLWVDTN